MLASPAAEIDFVSTAGASAHASRYAKLGWTAVVLLTAAYAGIFAWLSASSLQDYPNHLARAVAMSDLMFHSGERFGNLYQYHFSAVPYVLGDLALTFAVELFGVHGATTLWIGFVMLSLPLALVFYLRGTNIAPSAQILVLLLSLYLSTDGFLFMGFLTFRLAVAITVAGLALAHRLRERWSPSLYVWYCALIVGGYLIHLATLVFLLTAIGASGALRLWMRGTSARKELYFLIPIGALALWQFGAGDHAHAANDLTEDPNNWGSWYLKVRHLQWEYMRFYDTQIDGRIDKLLLLAFALCVALPVERRLSWAGFMKPPVLEMVVLTAAFLVMYIVLPSSLGGASYLDLRALALLPIFIVIGAAQYRGEKNPPADSRLRLATLLAVLVASGNLAFLTLHLVKDNAWMSRYRSIVAAVPKGARLLPLYPGTDQLKPFMHAAAFAVIDRSAQIPYLFSGNRGNPQTYFRYTHLPYAPPLTWYYIARPAAPDVDWGAVACNYDFLLVMKPFALDRIRMPTTPVAENASAALLAVGKHRCIRA